MGWIEEELMVYTELDSREIDCPEWDKAGHIHDWRHYVPDHVRGIWATLSREAREIVFVMAEKQADREVWD